MARPKRLNPSPLRERRFGEALSSAHRRSCAGDRHRARLVAADGSRRPHPRKIAVIPDCGGTCHDAQIGVYLTDDVARRFNVALRRSRTTKSALVNEALARFLNPPAATEPGHEAQRTLSALVKRVGRLHRETTVTSETLALFVRYYLMVAPPLPEGERRAAEAVGRKRYEVFVQEIAKRIGADTGLVTDVMRTIVATYPDLATDIRINMMTPGSVRTHNYELFSEGKAEIKRMMIASHPTKQILVPEDCVAPVLFLLSDAAFFCVGSSLVADGGYMTV